MNQRKGVPIRHALQTVEDPTLLPPSFMWGVAEGRGSQNICTANILKFPLFSEKWEPPPTSLRSATSPMNGGGKRFF